MSFLADLDVSVIDQLPPGRRPVVTKLVAVRRRDEVLARIRRDVPAGRQAYWVCPLVEESAAVEAAAATEHARAHRPHASRAAHRPAARTAARAPK